MAPRERLTAANGAEEALVLRGDAPRVLLIAADGAEVVPQDDDARGEPLGRGRREKLPMMQYEKHSPANRRHPEQGGA